MTSTTTIKVASATRDRLRQQARAAGSTMGAHLETLADLADREERFERLRTAVAATSPSDTASYKGETEEWETTELTDVR